MVGRNPNSTTPACANIEPWWSLFATATILIVGGSTGRQMLDSFVEQHVSLTARSMLKTGRCDTFNVIDPKFGNVVSNWSRRVHACTAPAMEAAGVGCADCVCTCRSPDWTDITATAMLKETWRGATIRFSWKPQLMTRADEAAFTRRLCHEEPLPDLVVVTKGLHDVYFLPKPTLAAHFDHVRRAFERFAQLLECFPSTTAIVVRAPMDGLRRRPASGVSWGNHSETDFLETTTQAMKVVTGRLAARRDGPVYFVDAFAETLHTQPNVTYVPCDGHHYRTGLHHAVWQEIAELTDTRCR